MVFGALNQSSGYKVSTPLYEGPLDLLLTLIERAELDITKLALAQVTDQYLDYLSRLQEHTALEVSAFLVVAARLLQIKSEALLPRPTAGTPVDEDLGEALAQQLRAYKRYRDVAVWLEGREIAGLRTYLRLAPPPKFEITPDLSNLTLDDLVDAARAILTREEDHPSLNSVVAAPRITIREKIRLIIKTLRRGGQSTFSSLVPDKSGRLEIVVTFLALLELIKSRLILARQSELFGEIELEPVEALNEDEELELEFGE